MRLTILLAIIILFNSCGTKKKEDLKKKELGLNENLISFRDSKVMEIDDLLQLDSSFYKSVFSGDFYEKTDTIEFYQNEIYVSYLAIVNGCADYAGDVQFNGDTLVLKVINQLDYVCTEQRCDRLTFRIKNEGNKKYIIKKW